MTPHQEEQMIEELLKMEQLVKLITDFIGNANVLDNKQCQNTAMVLVHSVIPSIRSLIEMFENEAYE